MPMRPSLVERLATHWRKHREYIRYNAKILNIYNGQLKPYLEDAIRRDYTSTQQQKEMIERVPTINILRSVVDKLAKVYVLPVSRKVESGQTTFDKIMHSIDIDSVMTTADEMLTLHKGCFIEPFVDEGSLDLRVVPLDRAIPYSDDPVNPLRPTAVMKLLGRETVNKDHFDFTDDEGIFEDENDYGSTQDIILVYTADVIFVMTGEGAVLKREHVSKYIEAPVFMGENGFAINPFGKLPFAYLNRSKFDLIPKPDNDLYDMTLLIPKLLADLNYAVKYQASSMLVATDLVLPEAAEKAPNSVMQVKSQPNAERQGKLEVIKPEIDISPVLSLIQGQLIMWLEARGIKAGSAGKASEQRASGLAKVIDSADATAERLAKIKVMSKFEKRELIPLISDFHRFARTTNDLEDAPTITKDLKLSRIEFPDQKPLQSMDDRKQLALDLYDRQLATADQVVDLLFPNMPESDKKAWTKDLNAESPMERLSAMSRLMNENTGGTVSEEDSSEREETDEQQDD